MSQTDSQYNMRNRAGNFNNIEQKEKLGNGVRVRRLAVSVRQPSTVSASGVFLSFYLLACKQQKHSRFSLLVEARVPFR